MSWIVADETSTPLQERAPLPERIARGATGRRPPGIGRRMNRRGALGTRCPVCGKGFGAGARFCPFDGEALRPDAAPRSVDPLLGVELGGRYRVDALVGEGGMGCVYQVTHVELSRPMAAKVLRAELVAVGDVSARFLEEARAAAAIDHPHVVRISDYGVLSGGRPYFVMELLTGESLRSLLGVEPMEPRRVAHIARQVARGLAAAHHVGVVHRDLKPDNVHVDQEAGDFVKVLDFGLARLPDAAKLTRRGVVFGTPQYMSPEQATGEPLDGRADIYALGVTMYEMLTGQVPFDAPTFAGVLQLHLHEPARSVQRLLPGKELGGLDAVVSRCLAKRPDRRFASMEEVIEALDGCHARLGGGSVATRDTEPSLSRESAPVRASSRRSPGAVVRWAGGSLALCGLVASVWFGGVGLREGVGLGGGGERRSAEPASHVDALRTAVRAEGTVSHAPVAAETAPPTSPPGPSDRATATDAPPGSPVASESALAVPAERGGGRAVQSSVASSPRAVSSRAVSPRTPLASAPSSRPPPRGPSSRAGSGEPGPSPGSNPSAPRHVAVPTSYPGEIIDPWAESGDPRP